MASLVVATTTTTTAGNSGLGKRSIFDARIDMLKEQIDACRQDAVLPRALLGRVVEIEDALKQMRIDFDILSDRVFAPESKDDDQSEQEPGPFFDRYNESEAEWRRE
jgi:hypothetical protein